MARSRFINDTETAVDDDIDTEGHRLATNDNETIVDGMRRLTPELGDEDASDELTAPGARRAHRR